VVPPGAAGKGGPFGSSPRHHRINGLYAGLLCSVVLLIAGTVGLGLRQPWLFPSLGPTLMMFFETPGATSSRPRQALLGHGIGILAGLAALTALGLQDHPSAVQEGLSASRVLAAALSLGLTTVILSLLDASHPPAGATTLIVSLGILTSAAQLGVMALAVLLITCVGVLLNRLMGVRQPWW
jgi:CBS-domain-containing membrane protein